MEELFERFGTLLGAARLYGCDAPTLAGLEQTFLDLSRMSKIVEEEAAFAARYRRKGQ
ncbi:MAG: hypothetical protein NT074_03650 [Methanomicrobiales archaeon]|nr:hypothetical protein [Methanomicrobiales archaeon]